MLSTIDKPTHHVHAVRNMTYKLTVYYRMLKTTFSYMNLEIVEIKSDNLFAPLCLQRNCIANKPKHLSMAAEGFPSVLYTDVNSSYRPCFCVAGLKGFSAVCDSCRQCSSFIVAQPNKLPWCIAEDGSKHIAFTSCFTVLDIYVLKKLCAVIYMYKSLFLFMWAGCLSRSSMQACLRCLILPDWLDRSPTELL